MLVFRLFFVQPCHTLTCQDCVTIPSCIWNPLWRKENVHWKVSILKNEPKFIPPNHSSKVWPYSRTTVLRNDNFRYFIEGLGCSHKDLQRSQHLSIESCLKKIQISKNENRELKRSSEVCCHPSGFATDSHCNVMCCNCRLEPHRVF